MKKMIVRRAKNDDVDRIIELRLINAQYHAELVSNGKLRADAESFFKKHTNELINDLQTKILVGIQNETIIAYAIGCIGQQHPIFDLGKQALIDDVYVSPDFQRHGYGNMLIKELLEWFNENHVERIELNVYKMNSKGVGFWDKQGFDTLFTRMFKEV